jgi:hypothetical protein
MVATAAVREGVDVMSVLRYCAFDSGTVSREETDDENRRRTEWGFWRDNI